MRWEEEGTGWDLNIERSCREMESGAIDTRQSESFQRQYPQLGPDTNSSGCQWVCAMGPWVGAGVSSVCVVVETVSSGWIATLSIRLEREKAQVFAGKR